MHLLPTYIPYSIKVALVIGNWALGSYCLAVTQAKHCIVFRIGPNANAQLPIDGFHSRDLQSCGTQITKAMAAMLVFLTKEVN